jgi:hypothetical protein
LKRRKLSQPRSHKTKNKSRKRLKSKNHQMRR